MRQFCSQMMHPHEAGLHAFVNIKSLYRMPLTILYFKGILSSTSGEEKEICRSEDFSVDYRRRRWVFLCAIALVRWGSMRVVFHVQRHLSGVQIPQETAARATEYGDGRPLHFVVQALRDGLDCRACIVVVDVPRYMQHDLHLGHAPRAALLARPGVTKPAAARRPQS